eukprot:1377782-Prymnesium_polylepis.1
MGVATGCDAFELVGKIEKKLEAMEVWGGNIDGQIVGVCDPKKLSTKHQGALDHAGVTLIMSTRKQGNADLQIKKQLELYSRLLPRDSSTVFVLVSSDSDFLEDLRAQMRMGRRVVSIYDSNRADIKAFQRAATDYCCWLSWHEKISPRKSTLHQGQPRRRQMSAPGPSTAGSVGRGGGGGQGEGRDWPEGSARYGPGGEGTGKGSRDGTIGGAMGWDSRGGGRDAGRDAGRDGGRDGGSG